MGGHLVAHQVINRAAWMGEDPWAFYQREGYQVRARGGEPPVPPPPAPHAETVDDIRSRLGEMRGEDPAAADAPQEPKNPAPLTAQDAWEPAEPIKEIKVKPKRTITRKFPSLFEMLASEGGLAPHPDLKAITDKNPFIPGFGRMIRQNGRSLDDALLRFVYHAFPSGNQNTTP